MNAFTTLGGAAALAVAGAAAQAAPVASFDLSADFFASNDGDLATLEAGGAFFGEILDPVAIGVPNDLIFSASVMATLPGSGGPVTLDLFTGAFQLDGIVLLDDVAEFAGEIGDIVDDLLIGGDPFLTAVIAFLGDLLADGTATFDDGITAVDVAIDAGATDTAVEGVFSVFAQTETALLEAFLFDLADIEGLPLGEIGGTLTVDLDISTAVIPLPATLPLMVAALGGIAVIRRRRAA